MFEHRMLTIAELESEPHFPNLLNDKDFVMYFWALPFIKSFSGGNPLALAGGRSRFLLS